MSIALQTATRTTHTYTHTYLELALGTDTHACTPQITDLPAYLP